MENKKRLCEVNSVIGYFHCWEHYSTPCARYPEGLVCGVSGIVEFPEGVQYVEPDQIHFIDEEALILAQINNDIIEENMKYVGKGQTNDDGTVEKQSEDNSSEFDEFMETLFSDISNALNNEVGKMMLGLLNACSDSNDKRSPGE